MEMETAHAALLIAGGLALAAIAAGTLAARLGTPILLVFLGLGMLAGEDGPGGIRFDDFGLTYMAGSVALVVVLIEAGLKTSVAAVRRVLRPALGLATVGVAVTTVTVASAAVTFGGLSWPTGLLMGALVAPTDAGAVATVLRASRLRIPPRISDTLEVESGINDPVSVFLTVLFVDLLANPHGATVGHAARLLAIGMGGGAALGLAAGWALRVAMPRLHGSEGLRPVLLLAGGLAVFGLAQMIEASGFLAVYLAAVVVGEGEGETGHATGLAATFDGFAWVAQIGLSLLLGLLVTPHDLLPHLGGALLLAATLMLVARPLAALLCLAPFGFSWREIAFIGWVGLRGGVPLYLAIVPVLARIAQGQAAFSVAFVIVLLSLAVQGWTVAPVARRLCVERRAPAETQ